MKIQYFFLMIIVPLFFVVPVRSEETAAPLSPTEYELEKTFEESSDGSGLYRHNEVYFLYGSPDTKVQISFKYQLVDDFHLYLGYTQLMFWDLDKDSYPFSDINYNPELFYRWKIGHPSLRGIDLGIYEHKSNGRDGVSSRSANRSYLASHSRFTKGSNNFEFDSKIFVYYGVDNNTNPDLPEKLGFLEFRAAWMNPWVPSFMRDSELEFVYLPGGKFDLNDLQGSQEVNFKFHFNIRRFNPSIFAQLFNGYGESFIQYDQNRTSYRIGISM